MSEEKKKSDKKKEKEISSSDPDKTVSLKPRGTGEAKAGASHAPSKQPSAAAHAAAPKTAGFIRIRQTKSGICTPVDQKQTLFGLGLRRIRQEVVRLDTPAIRGQVHKVRHLVEIVEGGAAR